MHLCHRFIKSKLQQNSSGELVLNVPSAHLYPVRRILRDHTHLQRKTLVDIAVTDQPAATMRFRVNYLLLSLLWNQRIIVKTEASECTTLDSRCSLYPSANWAEREAFDMFGIQFRGHPDRRRILTDYGFEGYPLRKDYPLTGFTEVRYDELEKRVVQEPVTLEQEMRQYHFNKNT